MRTRKTSYAYFFVCFACGLTLVACGGEGSDSDPGVTAHTDAGSEAPGSDAGEVSGDFAAQFLAAHNQVRSEAVPTPQPALPALQWNAEAAAVAQAWADRCEYGHNPNRGDYGENIAAAAPPRGQSPSWVVGQWASEAADYDYATNSCASGAVCGHYTQLVWRSTTSVGCATKVCTSNSPFGASFPEWQLWVCDYSPPGNYNGRKPY